MVKLQGHAILEAGTGLNRGLNRGRGALLDQPCASGP